MIALPVTAEDVLAAAVEFAAVEADPGSGRSIRAAYYARYLDTLNDYQAPEETPC